MKISLAIVISLITVVVGLIWEKSIVLPLSFLLASIVELPTRKWVNSDRLGSMRNSSFIIKSLLTLIGFYALIGQFICVIIIIRWFF